jgi:hypothetical protein
MTPQFEIYRREVWLYRLQHARHGCLTESSPALSFAIILKRYTDEIENNSTNTNARFALTPNEGTVYRSKFAGEPYVSSFAIMTIHREIQPRIP